MIDHARLLRWRALDQLRGLAIILMVLDHVLLQIEPTHSLRYTLTRLSLPLFMITAGTLYRPATPRRLARLAPAILVEATISTIVLESRPGIVTVYAIALLTTTATQHIPRLGTPRALIAIGLLQTLLLPITWTGYQPGLVLAFVNAGRLINPASLPAMSPDSRLATIGRYPMTWYVGHLLVLIAITAAI
jgi:hypothetical protein